jgi:hypothetical protein
MKRRFVMEHERINLLLDVMGNDRLSTVAKRKSLSLDLDAYHQIKRFSKLPSMGKILKLHMELMLDKPKPRKPSAKVTYRKKK